MTTTRTTLDIEMEIYRLKQELGAARLATVPEPVEDYELLTQSGPVRLSQLFGDHEDLLVIHNMGKSCSYCTLWADGLRSYLPMLLERTAVALVSPDEPDVQAEFAAQREWPYRMASDATRAFTTAMGFYGEHGWEPGATGFCMVDGKPHRLNRTSFGPGDDFCPVWPLMELVGGNKGWEPS